MYYYRMNTKEEIIKAAIELFSQRGFDGVSIREIANLANVHFASVRQHFGDKDNLYKTCISKHGESRLLSAQRFLSTKPTSPDDMRLRLGYAVEDVFRIHNENPFLTKLLLLEIESTNHRADAVFRKTMVAMTETFAIFFKACQEKKYLESDLDPLFLTQSLMGVIHHFIRTEPIRGRLLAHKMLKDKETKELMVEKIITLILGNKSKHGA